VVLNEDVETGYSFKKQILKDGGDIVNLKGS